MTGIATNLSGRIAAIISRNRDTEMEKQQTGEERLRTILSRWGAPKTGDDEAAIAAFREMSYDEEQIESTITALAVRAALLTDISYQAERVETHRQKKQAEDKARAEFKAAHKRLVDAFNEAREYEGAHGRQTELKTDLRNLHQRHPVLDMA